MLKREATASSAGRITVSGRGHTIGGKYKVDKMATSLSTSNLSGGKTGDLKNNVVKLLTEVQRMKLEVKVDLSRYGIVNWP